MQEFEASIYNFVEENISRFHSNRIKTVESMQLDKILKRKNPYLFKAKNIRTAESFVTVLMDAFLSSQEETIFGDFLEKLAIFACDMKKNGYKSGIEGIDLEFVRENARYIVSIKSGPNWGNSGQIKDMKANFIKAKRTLRTQNPDIHVVAVNGCCYGKNRKPDKGEYFKYCGQEFWELITDDDQFYLRIVEPLGHKAKEKNDAFFEEYAKVVNKLTKDFIQRYCTDDGSIDWLRIVKFNSGH